MRDTGEKGGRGGERGESLLPTGMLIASQA